MSTGGASSAASWGMSSVSASASARVQDRVTFQAAPEPPGSADEACAIDVDRRPRRGGRRVHGEPAHRLGDLGDGRRAAERQLAERSDAAAALEILLDHAGDGEAGAYR